ncbi:MAG: hypothetical protein ABIH66_10425, partial [bacterium]
MKSKVILTSFLLLVSIGLPLNKSFAQGGRVETVDSRVVTDYSKLAIALEQSGLKYQKADANVWVVSMQLEEKPAYDIRIVGNNEIIMFIVPLIQMPDKLTSEMLEKLDELNGRYFFVKFVHDKTSVYMRIDALLHSIDGLAVQTFVN